MHHNQATRPVFLDKDYSEGSTGKNLSNSSYEFQIWQRGRAGDSKKNWRRGHRELLLLVSMFRQIQNGRQVTLGMPISQ